MIAEIRNLVKGKNTLVQRWARGGVPWREAPESDFFANLARNANGPIVLGC
jgi:hypothetical protein